MEHAASGPQGPEAAAVETGGVSRRDALKKGALVGGAVMWAVPVVQSIGMSSASAQTASAQMASPTGTGISYIAFSFRCGGQLYFVKIETDTFECQGVNSSRNCGIRLADALSGCDRGLFTVSDPVRSAGGEVLSVQVTLLCAGGTFVEVKTKCGNGTPAGGCIDGTGTGTNTATFSCAPPTVP